jgi:hypothetical protein
MPPIPPELYRHPCCEHWALLSFGLDYSRPIWRKTERAADRYQWVIWTDYQGYNVNQITNTAWLIKWARESLKSQREAEDRADKAERELRQLTNYIGLSVLR